MILKKPHKDSHLLRGLSPKSHFILKYVEQDVLISPNPRGKLEDLAVGCVCVV